MAKIIKPLNQAQVLALKNTTKRVFTAVDSNGLYVDSRPTGQSWVVRVGAGNKRSWRKIGEVGSMPLATARIEVAKLKAEPAGIPSRIPLPTFKKQAGIFIEDLEKQLKNEKNLKQWTTTMTEFAYPVIGSTPIDEITPTQIKEIINTILPRVVTANRFRARMERIIDSAWIEHRTNDVYVNPASAKIVNVLASGITKKKKVEHHLAVPVEDAAGIFHDC